MIQEAVNNMAVSDGEHKDYIIFCDDIHYRVVFREGSHWHLFDSLWHYGAFEREV